MTTNTTYKTKKEANEALENSGLEEMPKGKFFQPGRYELPGTCYAPSDYYLPGTCYAPSDCYVSPVGHTSMIDLEDDRY